MDAEIFQSTQDFVMTLGEHLKALRNKELFRNNVYDEYVLKREYSLKGFMNRFGTTGTQIGARRKMRRSLILHVMQRHWPIGNVDRVRWTRGIPKMSQRIAVKIRLLGRDPQNRELSPTSTQTQWQYPQHSCTLRPLASRWWHSSCPTRMIATAGLVINCIGQLCPAL